MTETVQIIEYADSAVIDLGVPQIPFVDIEAPSQFIAEIYTRGQQGPEGDVTPEALAAQQAAEDAAAEAEATVADVTTTANEAKTTADNAYLKAEAAESDASTALSTANTAQTTAADAADEAAQAVADAAEAQTTADSRATTAYVDQAEADAISTAAADATTKANTAESNATAVANAAQSDADNAQSAASAAQADATQALTDAATAQTAADAAQNDADNAQTTANTALSTANTAQGDATQALADAASAQSTADSKATTAYVDTAEQDAISAAATDATNKVDAVTDTIGQANGIAPLDADSRVPSINLPPFSSDDYVEATAVGQPNGVAALDSDGMVLQNGLVLSDEAALVDADLQAFKQSVASNEDLFFTYSMFTADSQDDNFWMICNAPFNMTLLGITLVTFPGISGSNTNYWSFAVERLPTSGGPIGLITRTTQTSGTNAGGTIPAQREWTFDGSIWSSRLVPAGNTIRVVPSKTGSPPAMPNRITMTVRYQREAV